MIEDLKVITLGIIVGCLALAICFIGSTLTHPPLAERAAVVAVP